MKKYLGTIVLLASFSASANYVRLECAPLQPCKYADDQCITSIKIAGEAHDAEETVAIQANGRSFVETIPVSVAQNQKALSFASENGDDWGRLTRSGAGVYTGIITYSQDFEYEVRCLDKSFGLEPGFTIRN